MTGNQVGTDPGIAGREYYSGANMAWYGLTLASAAVDAGLAATCTAVGADQRFAARTVNGNFTGGFECDAGAVESGGLTSSTLSLPSVTAAQIGVFGVGAAVESSTITARVTNQYADAMRTVSLDIALPVGVDVHGSLPAGCTLLAPTITCTVSGIAPGAFAEVVIAVKASTAGVKLVTFNTTSRTPANVPGTTNSTTITVLAPPANSVLPAITGGTTVGESISCSTGTWTGSPTYTYAWLRNGVPIGITAAAAYVLAAADADATISCTVTATGPNGVTSASSNGIVAHAVPPVVVPPPPVVQLPTKMVFGFRNLVGTRLSTCGITVRSACVARRIVRGRRIIAFRMRGAATPAGTRAPTTSRVLVQRKVGSRWVTVKLTSTATLMKLGATNLGTWTMPPSLRRVNATLRIRASFASSSTTTAATSVWRYVSVR